MSATPTPATRNPRILPFVHDILDDNPTGYLGTVRPDGQLSITPLALLFDGTTIRLSTTTDRKKYRNLLADPRVALCVPHRNNPNRYVRCAAPSGWFRTLTGRSSTRWPRSTWTPMSTPSTLRHRSGHPRDHPPADLDPPDPLEEKNSLQPDR